MPTWVAVRRVADRYESRIRRVVAEAAAEARAAFDVDLAQRGFDRHDPELVSAALGNAVSHMRSILEMRLPGLLRGAMGEARSLAPVFKARRLMSGPRIAKAPAPAAMSFDLTNPEAVAWLRERAGTLITNITSSQRQAIRNILVRSFEEGIPVDAAAREIRQYIGLTEGYAEAVANLRRAIRANPGKKLWAGKSAVRVPKEGASREFIARRSQQYADRLLNPRAKAIARTESVAAANEGQRQLWLQAVKKDLLDATIQREWIATPDERLCPICENTNGEVRGLNEPFSIGVMGPPAHALCRCATGLTIQHKSKRAA